MVTAVLLTVTKLLLPTLKVLASRDMKIKCVRVEKYFYINLEYFSVIYIVFIPYYLVYPMIL